MFNRIYHSAIFNSWFSNAIILFSSIIAIPIVITKLNIEEINVWLLLGSIVAISKSVILGFNGTLLRFIAYSHAGVKIEDFKSLKMKKTNKTNEFNIEEFSSIYFMLKRIYVYLSLTYIAIILTISYFGLQKPIGELSYESDGWIATLIILISTSTTVIFGFYQIFLNGIGKVADVQRIVGIVNLFGLFFILLTLYMYATLISIVLVYQLVAVFTTFVLVIKAKKEMKHFEFDEKSNKFDKKLFSVIWDSSWKSTITTILANIIRHISAILVAQLFTPTVSASFLFTKKIFDIIDGFCKATFQARIPVLAKYRGTGNLDTFIPYLRKTEYLSYGVFLIGYVALLIGNEYILPLFSSNVELGSTTLIIIFSYTIFISRWAGMTAAISSISNHVIDHIYIFFVAIIYFVTLYAFYESVGINIFPLAILCGFVLSSPILISAVYQTIHVSFVEYEKQTLLPMFGILTLINLIYYWSNI